MVNATRVRCRRSIFHLLVLGGLGLRKNQSRGLHRFRVHDGRDR